MPLKAIFFDIDGTLVDSNDFHVMAWNEAFHDHGFEIGPDRIRAQIGKGADQLIPDLLPAVDPKTAAAIADRHGQLFGLRYLHDVQPFPRAGDLIEVLHAKGRKIVLASSAKRDEVQHYIELLKIGQMLTSAVSQDDVENSKPHGDIFAAALASVFPVAASEVIAVGDTPFDVQAALQCGVRTIGVRSGGFSSETLAEAGAPYIYASVKDLFDNFAASPLRD